MLNLHLIVRSANFVFGVGADKRGLRLPSGFVSDVLCASPEYFKEAGKPNSLMDLSQHRIISHISRHNKHLQFKQHQWQSIKPTLLVNRVEAMIECACLGLGMVQLPIYMLQKQLHAGNLLEVLPDLQRQDVAIYYYYPKFRHTQPKIRAFINFFLKDTMDVLL